jgi:uncharacterized phage infection (PIP) family protein YhgE
MIFNRKKLDKESLDRLAELRGEVKAIELRLKKKEDELTKIEKDLKNTSWNAGILQDKSRSILVNSKINFLKEAKELLLNETKQLMDELRTVKKELATTEREIGKKAAIQGEPEIRKALEDLLKKVEAAQKANIDYYELKKSFGGYAKGKWPISLYQLDVFQIKPWLTGVRKFLKGK